QEEHYRLLIRQMTTLNSIGEDLGKIKGVHAMTDVTGFGLLGHLIEMTEGSGLSAEINYTTIRKMKGLDDYIKLRTVPGATSRNWNSYGHKVEFGDGINNSDANTILADPQTNGGLLVAVSDEATEAVRKIFLKNGLEDFMDPI